MNKNLVPKYVSKFLTLFVLVGGLVFLLSGSTLGFDYPEFDNGYAQDGYAHFDNCMVTAHDTVSYCYYQAYVPHNSCVSGCDPSNPNYNQCITDCNTTENTAKEKCDTEYNSRIFGDPPPSTVPALGAGYSTCYSNSVPNYKQIEKRCRLESSRLYNHCLQNPNLGCFVNGEPDTSCCSQMEADNVQGCLYP